MSYDEVFLTFTFVIDILSTLVCINFSTLIHVDYLVPICTTEHLKGDPKVLSYRTIHLVHHSHFYAFMLWSDTMQTVSFASLGCNNLSQEMMST